MSMLDGFEEYFHSKYENIVLESMEDIDLAFDFAIESASDKFVGLSPKDEEEILNGDWEDDEVTDMDNVDLSDDENFEPDEECGSLDSLLSLLDDDDETEALESLSAALEKSDSGNNSEDDDFECSTESDEWDDENKTGECNESEDDDNLDELGDWEDDEDSDMFDDELDEPDEECGTESDISLESLLDDISNI